CIAHHQGEKWHHASARGAAKSKPLHTFTARTASGVAFRCVGSPMGCVRLGRARRFAVSARGLGTAAEQTLARAQARATDVCAQRWLPAAAPRAGRAPAAGAFGALRAGAD